MYKNFIGVIFTKYIKIILITFLILVILFVAFVYWLLTDEVKFVSDYCQIEVLETDIADYRVFVTPSGEFHGLWYIDEPIRMEIAKYMKKKNLRLAPGIQEFNKNRKDARSLIKKDFKFEKIKE